MSYENFNKRYNPTSSVGSDRLGSLLKSPEATIPGHRELSTSILRNKNDNFASASRGRANRNNNSISKKVSYADPSAKRSDHGQTELNLEERSNRKTTPKKYYFFSDYLKDFNPGLDEYKSPSAAEYKSVFQEKPLGSTTYESAAYSKGVSHERKEYRQPEDKDPISSNDLYGSGHYSARAQKVHTTPHRTSNRDSHRSPGDVDDDRDKRNKANRKDEIKEKLLKLSDKLYSPIRHDYVDERRKSGITNDISLRGISKDDMLGGNAYSYFLTQDNLETMEDRHDTHNKSISRVETQTYDIKHKIMVQDYENSITSLKSHLEKVERSNIDNVNRLREELRAAREEQLNERSEITTKNDSEIRALNERIRDLEDQVRQEKENVISLEEKLQDSKASYEKKLSDLTKEIERAKNDKERRVEELSNQLKSQAHSQREIVANIRSENESTLKKMRDEQNLVLRDLSLQLDRKASDLERVQRERSETVNALNEKIANLQDLTKHNQDTYTKLSRTIELKDDEIEKLTRRLNDTKKECSVLTNQIDALEHDRTRLDEENDRLRSKTTRLEKMIYGRGKGSPQKVL